MLLGRPRGMQASTRQRRGSGGHARRTNRTQTRPDQSRKHRPAGQRRSSVPDTHGACKDPKVLWVCVDVINYDTATDT